MRPFKRQCLLLIIVLLFAAGGLLTACGKKGPLYLPNKTQQSKP